MKAPPRRGQGIPESRATRRRTPALAQPAPGRPQRHLPAVQRPPVKLAHQGPRGRQQASRDGYFHGVADEERCQRPSLGCVSQSRAERAGFSVNERPPHGRRVISSNTLMSEPKKSNAVSFFSRCDSPSSDTPSMHGESGFPLRERHVSYRDTPGTCTWHTRASWRLVIAPIAGRLLSRSPVAVTLFTARVRGTHDH